MGITPLAFTGISKFSTDFQTILSRSVSIASLPARLLENEQAETLTKKTAVADLRTSVADLAAKMQALGNLGAGGALTASSSSSAVAVRVGSGAAPGVYQISDITSLATEAIAASSAGVATLETQISSGDHTLELVVVGVTKSLELTAATDNLEGVRDAINQSGMGVTASIIDTHAEGSRYFLSITANSPGTTPIELRTVAGSAASNLMSQTRPGSNAVFKVNGQSVTAADNSISSVIPGVILELGTTTEAGETITVSVKADSTPISEALQGFVEAYNAVAAKLDTQVGPNAGALSGDSVIGDVSGVLRELSGYSGGEGIRSLMELGITLDVSGQMSIDSTVVDWMSAADLQAVFDFLGDGSTGFSQLDSSLTALSDPLSGTMRAMLESYDDTDSRLTQQIATITDRVNAMQATLMAKLQAADALLASLEGQQNMLTASIESLNMVTNGKREG